MHVSVLNMTMSKFLYLMLIFSFYPYFYFCNVRNLNPELFAVNGHHFLKDSYLSR